MEVSISINVPLGLHGMRGAVNRNATGLNPMNED